MTSVVVWALYEGRLGGKEVAASMMVVLGKTNIVWSRIDDLCQHKMQIIARFSAPLLLVLTPQKVRFELVRTSVLLPCPCPEPRTRTVMASGWTEPELNRTVGSVLPVLVLCVSSELNFGNPKGEVWVCISLLAACPPPPSHMYLCFFPCFSSCPYGHKKKSKYTCN
jgi:hypothetical protein